MLIVLALGLVLAFAALTAFRPFLGLCLLGVTLPLDFPVEIGITAYTNELALAGLLLGSGYLWWKEKTWKTRHWNILLWSMPFVLAIAISVLFSQAWSAGAKQLLRWLQLILIFWFAANAFQNKIEFKRIISVLITVAALASLYGLIKSLVLNIHSGQLLLYGGDVVRVNSTFGHSNQFGGYLLCVLPMAVVGFFQAKHKWLKAGAVAAVALMALAMVFTYTRSLWLATALVGGVWLYFKVPKKISALCCVGLIVLGGIFIAIAAQPENPGHRLYQRAISIFQPQQEDSVNFRMVCAKTAFAMFSNNPLTGFGAGNYDQHITKYFSQDYYAWEAMNKHIHNLFLQLLIETGLLGLLGFLFLLAMSLGNMVKTIGQHWEPETGPWLEAILAGVAGFLLANLFDVLTIYARGIHFGLLLGLGLGLVYMRHKNT